VGVKASVLASRWHSPKAVKPAKAWRAQRRARSGLLALLFPLLRCWRASHKFARIEQETQLGSVRLKASVNKPCQIKFSTAEPFGTMSAYQTSPSARNDILGNPTGSMKNDLGENLSLLVILSGFLCCGEYPCLPLLQRRVGWLSHNLS